MKKLFCSKISHNPYKEEMITEIIERVFQIDGYCVEEKIEGVLFDIHFDDEQVTSIKISNTNMRKYFEDNFNKGSLIKLKNMLSPYWWKVMK